jgi:hypothetical protein
MNQVVVLYAETVLDAAGFVTDAYSMLFVWNMTRLCIRTGMFADCHATSEKKAYEAASRRNILCETELKLLCLMRAWFLTYYDRSSATYEKCRNVLRL